MHRLTTAAILAAAVATRAAQAPPLNKQRVSFTSHGLTLAGFLFKPDGPGPFPAVVWNHGSEKNPGGGPQFDAVAGIFVPHGYVVFAPIRRGHEMSAGRYILDERDAARGLGQGPQTIVRLLETEQLDDQLAGFEYVKRLPYVDPSRLVVAGCSFGGIQTLLAAERGAGYRAAVAISPGAQSWNGNVPLRERLVAAARRPVIPVSLTQPPRAASLEPSRVVGAELERHGKQNAVKVYPP